MKKVLTFMLVVSLGACLNAMETSKAQAATEQRTSLSSKIADVDARDRKNDRLMAIIALTTASINNRVVYSSRLPDGSSEIFYDSGEHTLDNYRAYEDLNHPA